MANVEAVASPQGTKRTRDDVEAEDAAQNTNTANQDDDDTSSDDDDDLGPALPSAVAAPKRSVESCLTRSYMLPRSLPRKDTRSL
ncbi:unnamed protein product, partial [Aureobasidium pullulans]